MKWFINAIKKYATFNGRARRKEYWNFYLFMIISLVVVSIMDFILGTYIISIPYPVVGEIIRSGIGILYTLSSLFFIIPTLAVSVRRLHDVGKSGAYLFVQLIPVVGAIWFLILLCTDSDLGVNRYGESPKA